MIIHKQLLLLSQPHPPLLLNKPEFPLPQKHSKRIIQIIEFPLPKLIPHPQLSLHPQFVAVKSLISDLLKFMFTIYGMTKANNGYKNVDFIA